MPSRSLEISFVPVCLCAVAILLSGTAMAAPVVQLAASLTSPQPLGTAVALTASATDASEGTISYRFEIGSANSTQFNLVRDYSVGTTFTYTPTVHEGNYQFQVTARNNTTKQTAIAKIIPFQFTSLISGSGPVVTPTGNPLVALFSAPSCPTGSLMRVSFVRDNVIRVVNTPWQECLTGASMNFLIAGMRAASLYRMHSTTLNGSNTTNGPVVPYTTGTLPFSFSGISVPSSATQHDSLTEQFLLLSNITPSFPYAVDLSGAPVWYYKDPDPSSNQPLLTKPVAGGNMLMITNGPNSIAGTVDAAQVLREIDLAGNVIRETNTSRMSEQVSALSGIPSSCQLGSTLCLVGALTHEAVRLSNGHTLVLGSEEKIFTDGTQGSSAANPVDVIGNIILDLDTNWQVAWYWRSFDHLNANRAAVLGEKCIPKQFGCVPLFLTTGIANDWLHGNTLDRAVDGSILFSMRHQDWVVKINYNNGAGTGNVLWTLGLGGDFTINSTDLYPWFSHQHDVGFELGGTTILSLEDNGNTRVQPPPMGLGSGNSRGYVLSIDQTNRTATPLLLADMGVYSLAFGSAHRLSNGDYHFEEGLLGLGLSNEGGLLGLAIHNQATEVAPTSIQGTLGYQFQERGDFTYRAVRMTDLYSLPQKYATQ